MRWCLYDDGDTGHHPGYQSGLAEASLELGMAPVVAGPARPPHIPDHDWVPVSPSSQRDLVAGYRSISKASREAQKRGVDVFWDLFFDKNGWVSGGIGPFPVRVHVIHHARHFTNTGRTGWGRLRNRIFQSRTHRLTAGRNAFVVVHTDRARDLVTPFVARPEQLVLAGYPVPFATPNGGSDSPLRAEPTILAVGGTRKEKGLDLLLEAMSLRGEDDVSVEVVGDQPEGVRDWARSKYEGPIIWHDRRISDAELLDAYRRALMVALPYSPEAWEHGGASAVLIEALREGTPVVITSVLAAQLPPGYGGAVAAESDDPEGFAAAIDNALSNVATLKSAARSQGPPYVRDKHSFERYLTTIADVVKQRSE